MMQIRELFHPNRDIYRTIEKVITYGSSEEVRLKKEISEYEVTHSIEENLQRLLDRMQLAMEAGGENEIGVWVSGFYGSGKSSFTKYLGFAFDSDRGIEGVPFVQYLHDRLNTPQAKALLNTVTRRFPAAVVMLDLASEMVAGATMEDVSSVLYYKVLQWAGYSKNLKVFALQRKLEKDGRFQEFLDKIAETLPGLPWDELKDDLLIADGLFPKLAHEMYPGIFATATSFSTNSDFVKRSERERVEEMLGLVREKSGKPHVLFVIDEVGQYVGSRDNLITNVDGLAKNLKDIGNGKAWIIATAQQTLTEDDPRAALNSDKLFKLKDRFPITVDLESSDIREICYRRLLGKSPAGEQELGRLFDAHGQQLRYNTKLQNARYYDSDFSKTSFTNLYPFLPAHFDILLHLLGALAKSTGGIGLRSAIKVVQDILVETGEGRTPAAERSIGWLATTVTLYDALEKDIRRAFPSIHQAVQTTLLRFHGSALHADVAKTIAVLQILGNLPATVENVASLLHPAIEANSRLDEVKQAVQEMRADPLTPLGEKDGNLSFLSEKLRDIEKERGDLPLRSVETRRIENEGLRDCFDPLPKAMVHSTLTVAAGLKVRSGGVPTALAGEREPIQLIVEFAPTAGYDTARQSLVNESRTPTAQYSLFLLARENPEIAMLAQEIYRSQRIVELHRNDPDQEVKDYCASQTDHAARLAQELQRKLRDTLLQGSFVFRGDTDAVASLDPQVAEAAKKTLETAANRIFDRYAEAPIRAEMGLAETFLRAFPAGIRSANDPLSLVSTQGGRPTIHVAQRAIVSIRDYIDRTGTIEGKRLQDHFGDPPFGWSPDTVRYLVAAMLVAGELKLKVSGREVTTAGQQAIDALKTNTAFKAVGLSLRDERPSNEMLARAAERLSELVGDTVFPLEQEISKAAIKHLPRFQQDYAPLSEKLASLGIAGKERLETLSRDITDTLYTDASDAPQRFGASESALYSNLKWAGQVKQALDNGMEATVRALQEHRRDIERLPATGTPGGLKRDLAEDLRLFQQRLESETFPEYGAEFSMLLTTIKNKVRDAVAAMDAGLTERLRQAADDLARMPEWRELTQEEQSNAAASLDALALTPTPDLAGLQALLNRAQEIADTVADLQARIRRQVQEERLKQVQEERSVYQGEGDPPPSPLTKRVSLPKSVTSLATLDELIQRLTALRAEASETDGISLMIELAE
jgi:hypothetical protein